jgi:GH24 family phage-related lysozyme (muramidase)
VIRGAAALVLLLAACQRPEVPAPPVVEEPPPTPTAAPAVAQEAVVADQPLPQAVEAAAEAIQAPIMAAVEALEPLTPVEAPPPPEDARSAACRRSAATLIIRWEISSQKRYERSLRFPVWPGGASGVTWGVGYDGGHQTASVIADDWRTHAGRDRLAGTAGLTGKRAATALPRFRDIETAYGYAAEVFETRSLVEYERRTERAFREAFERLRPNACAALVSLVYNRGASMVGDHRKEMRNIRDQCVPATDYGCIAAEIRSMKRLWRGTVNENGLSARRESEALLVETP